MCDTWKRQGLRPAVHRDGQHLRLLEDVRRLRRLRNDLLPCRIWRLHEASLQGQERSSSQYIALHTLRHTASARLLQVGIYHLNAEQMVLGDQLV
jgi:integrase